ncbi:hypothetical protein [Mycobacterium avium]|uniref:hypothetical protein n=1 Tax=Mycobacterium avium TaxID=1764 RepID=UPI0012DADD7A|nr:hypothetical protein [Mycobacterium avium]
MNIRKGRGANCIAIYLTSTRDKPSMVSMCSVSGSHVWLRAWVASAGSIVGCVERKLRRRESASPTPDFNGVDGAIRPRYGVNVGSEGRAKAASILSWVAPVISRQVGCDELSKPGSANSGGTIVRTQPPIRFRLTH